MAKLKGVREWKRGDRYHCDLCDIHYGPFSIRCSCCTPPKTLCMVCLDKHKKGLRPDAFLKELEWLKDVP